MIFESMPIPEDDRDNSDGPWRFESAAASDQSGDEAEGDGDAATPSGPAPEQRPTSRADMKKLHEQFQNNMAMVTHLYRDLALKDELRMTFIAVEPYMNEYSQTLRCQKSKDWMYPFPTGLFSYFLTIRP